MHQRQPHWDRRRQHAEETQNQGNQIEHLEEVRECGRTGREEEEEEEEEEERERERERERLILRLTSCSK